MPRIDSHSPGDFNWFDLFSKDLEASKTFYSAIFGWTAEDQPNTGGGAYTMFMKDGVAVAGGGQMSPEMMEGGAPPSWNAYVSTNELETVLASAEANGGKVVFPPQDVPEHGRLAYLADPEGAVIALWQPQGHSGSGWAKEPGTVCWVELASRGTHAAADFYGKLFGWNYADHPDGGPKDYRVIKNAGEDIGGMLPMTAEWGEMPAHWSVYFEVDDIGAKTAKIGEIGGEVKFGPFEAPIGQIAVCADDGGAHFYLMEFNDAFKAKR